MNERSDYTVAERTVVTIATSKFVTRYLLDGNRELRQCVGNCIFWNMDKPYLINSCFIFGNHYYPLPGSRDMWVGLCPSLCGSVRSLKMVWFSLLQVQITMFQFRRRECCCARTADRTLNQVLRTRGHSFQLPTCSFNLHKKSFVISCLLKFLTWLCSCFVCVFFIFNCFFSNVLLISVYHV